MAVFDTPEAIEAFRLVCLIQALEWKAKFGGEIGRNVRVLKTVKRDYPEWYERTAALILERHRSKIEAKIQEWKAKGAPGYSE